MGTKANPRPNDCYEAADDDEPVFTLRAKDPTMATVIAFWADTRVAAGLETDDDPKIVEARDDITAVQRWRNANPDRIKTWP